MPFTAAQAKARGLWDAAKQARADAASLSCSGTSAWCSIDHTAPRRSSHFASEERPDDEPEPPVQQGAAHGDQRGQGDD